MKKILLSLALMSGILTSCAPKVEGDIVAKVNGNAITQTVIDEKIKGILPMVKMQKRDFTAEDSVQLVKDIIDMEVLIEVIKAEAKTDANLAVTDSLVEQEIEKSKAKFFGGNDSIMTAKLAENNQTVEDFKKDLRVSLLVDKFFKALSASIVVDSTSIATYFNANKSDFVKYPTSHILVMPKPDSLTSVAAADSIALEKIKVIEDSLKTGKAKFEDLARNNSHCPSSKNGGDLGAGSVKSWDKAFGDAVLTLKAGEISGVVKSQFGYHLIKLNDAPTDSLSKRDEYTITNKLKKELMDKAIESVKSKYKIEYTEAKK